MLIVEVQLGIDAGKRFTWPEYAMGARAMHRCPVGLLVVAPDPDVAAWCAEPIETGIPGFVLRPPVLRRAAVPVVTDPAEAARRPELAVLSAMAHGETEQGAAIAAAVLPAIRELDDERARFYGDLVYNSLNEAARRALEAMMKGYEYQSDFAKKYVAQGREAEGARRGGGARPADRAPGSRHRRAGRRARAHPGREGSGAAGALAGEGRRRRLARRGARRAELRLCPGSAKSRLELRRLRTQTLQRQGAGDAPPAPQDFAPTPTGQP